WLKDSSSQLNIEQIVSLPKQNFMPYIWDSLALGASTNWLRFTVKNENNKPQKIVIQTTKFDFLDFYFQDSNKSWKKKSTGTSVLQANKELVYGAYSVVKIPLEAHSKQDIYIKATYLNREPIDVAPIQMSFTAHSETSFESYKNMRDLAMAFYTGALIIMLLYNFFLFVITKDINYFLYLFIAISIYFFIFFSSGLGVDYIEEASQTSYYLALTSFFHINLHVIFAFYILRLSEFLSKSYKSIIILLVIYDVLLVLATVMTGNLGLFFRALATPLVFGIFAYTLFLAYKVWKKNNYAPAFYFLVANFFYMVFMVIAVFQLLGALPFLFLGLESWQNNLIGSLIELTLFSLSIGAKITYIQKEIKQQQLNQVKIRQEEEAKRAALIEEKNKELEQKVRERTAEVVEKSEEIQQQNEELQRTSEQLEGQHKFLTELYNDTQASINYAQRIQDAILPKPDLLEACFNSYFILFKPRDIVSGDFYWAADIWVNGFKKEVFVAADCTGHGVPGAFMSLICANLLNQIVVERKVVEPQVILEKVDKALRIFLNKATTKNHDGMDCAIIVIDKKKRLLEFSGAKRPLVYFKNNRITRIKGDAKSIGGHEREGKFFSKHTLELDSETTYYLYSDGYADQIGGPKKRKFMTKHFRKLLTDIHHLPLEEQKMILEDKLIAWQGKEEQVDDILVVGFR
ncbi:MAG: SpoIIE family protein phosphatase, partial [Bernardetiaceae bacterium]|nr:SpoIIE family protein phosphatase [Bernardetiaceae bacterium]